MIDTTPWFQKISPALLVTVAHLAALAFGGGPHDAGEVNHRQVGGVWRRELHHDRIGRKTARALRQVLVVMGRVRVGGFENQNEL